MMERWPARKLLVLLLGALLALGLGLSAVQAGEMTVKMTQASDMGTPGNDGCTGCGGDDGNAKAGSCHPVCTVAATAVLCWGPVVAATASDAPFPTLSPVTAGHASSPDPSPPRGRVLG